MNYGKRVAKALHYSMMAAFVAVILVTAIVVALIAVAIWWLTR